MAVDRDDEVRFDVIAQRGDDLVLGRLDFAGPRNFDVASLSLYVVGPDGRMARGIRFDPDDLDAAMAELDRLAAPLTNRVDHAAASLPDATTQPCIPA